jgi:hypothetical protein
MIKQHFFQNKTTLYAELAHRAAIGEAGSHHPIDLREELKENFPSMKSLELST